MFMQNQFGIVVLLLFFDIVTWVKTEGCFGPDTTWDGETNQGFFNVTSKVITQNIQLYPHHHPDSMWRPPIGVPCSVTKKS